MSEQQRLVGYNYALSFDLGGNRGIQVNGNFYADDDVAAMNLKLDQVWAVLERLRAKVEVPIVEGNLAQARQMVRQTEEMLVRLAAADEERKSNGKMPVAQQKADLANHRVNLMRQREDVAKYEQQLAETRARAM